MHNPRLSSFLLFVLCSALVLTTSPATAQYFGRNKVQYDDFNFKRFGTEHFTFYFYPEERQAVEDAARMGERWYTRHSNTFQRELRTIKPVIFYANDADFQQTNVISGAIGQGTGGVTESLKERVVMPLTGQYSETDHVLGHELVHSFQYDLFLHPDDTLRFDIRALPLWLVEGMAEYLSVGRVDPHTAMWLRDAALRDDLPTMEQLTRRPNEYFPYRYGQAYMAYVGGMFGDRTVPSLFKWGGHIGLDSAFVRATGATQQEISEGWQQAVKDTYLPLMEGRQEPSDVGREVLEASTDGVSLNLAPSVSPDGRYVAFLSERDLFYINLFIADTRTGEVVQSVRSMSSDPHFDAIRFINSSGSWSPDGDRLAFITFVKGDNEVAILNVESGRVERRYRIDGATALSNPAWSPDGQRLVVSGLDGGISDLYLLDLDTRAIRQLTDDRFADLQPAWSPDGRTIAFVTDRNPGGSNFETLSFGSPRIGLMDVETGTIDILRPFGDRALHHNPVFSPDGRSLYFISDWDGFKDGYRYDLTTGRTYRITYLKTGISGITAMSPALSVAASTGEVVFSVFSDNTYAVHVLTAEEARGEPLQQTDPGGRIAATLPPVQPRRGGLVAAYLDDPTAGLPQATTREVRNYRPRISLSAVVPPSIAASTGGVYGTRVSGGIGFLFSDMLNRHSLTAVLQVQGSLKDIGGQFSYLNQAHRFNLGASLAHIPLLYGGARSGIETDPETGLPVRIIERLFQRIYVDQALVATAYPLSTTRRIELNAGATRYGFDFDLERTIIYPNGAGERETEDLAAPDPEFVAQAGLAYVGDYSFMGLTSPLQGARYRFEVGPQYNGNLYSIVLADYRRYAFRRPFTFAVRGLHIGNYGATGEELFTNEYLGYAYYPGFVHGYSIRSFDASECSIDNGRCPETERLVGTRIAVASAELRLALLGPSQLAVLNFPYLPTELTLFADAGLAWTAEEPPVLKFDRDSPERIPVTSVGVLLRVNLLGALVFEPYFAYPFQRPDKDWHFGLRLTPGW